MSYSKYVLFAKSEQGLAEIWSTKGIKFFRHELLELPKDSDTIITRMDVYTTLVNIYALVYSLMKQVKNKNRIIYVHEDFDIHHKKIIVLTIHQQIKQISYWMLNKKKIYSINMLKTT